MAQIIGRHDLGRTARRRLISPARLITTAVELQLRAEGRRRERLAQPLTPHAARPERPHRRTDSEPSIYRIARPSPPRPAAPEPVDAEHPIPSAGPPAREPVLASEVEDAGRPGEDGLAAAPEPSPDNAPPEPDSPSPALSVFVFGATRIFWRAPESGEQVDITSQLQPRSREVVALLALHPEGLSRARVIELIWGGQSPERSAALSNTLSRLRASITTATGGHITSVLIDDRLHCRLSANAASVDYWDFLAAVAARRHAVSDTDRSAACRAITSIATTDLATDLTGTWTEPLRESARRDTHNALDWLATHDADHDPRTTLGLLERTAETDPYNETVWRDILRQHALLGEYAALARTYTLLTRRLSEIGETPSRETRQLLEHLRRGEDRNPHHPES